MIHKSTFNPNFAAIGHFRVPPGLCFKRRVGLQPLIWKSFFILMQIKLSFVEFARVAITQRSVEETKNGFAAEQLWFLGIHYLHISHNTPCLPPKILYNLTFFISLGLQSFQEN